MLTVRCKHTRDGFAPLLLTLRVRRAVAFACAVKAGQVHARFGDQGNQAGDEVQRLENHMRGSIRIANLTGDPWFSDSYRIVLWVTPEPLSIDDLDFLEWRLPH